MLKKINLPVTTQIKIDKMIWLNRLLFAKAFMAIVPIYLLQALFAYPQILDKRTDIVQTLYRQNEVLIGLAFGLLALSGLVFAALNYYLPTVLGQKQTQQITFLARLGIAIGLLQFVSFLLAPFLIPTNFAFFRSSFIFANQFLAIFLLAWWTLGLTLLLRKQNRIGRNQAWLGFLAAFGLEVSLFKPLTALFGISLKPVEMTDFDFAGLLNLTAQVSDALWLIWLIWLAFSLKNLINKNILD